MRHLLTLMGSFSPRTLHSKSGASDKVIGYSPSAGMVITVIYLRDGHRGLTAWKASRAERRIYWEEG